MFPKAQELITEVMQHYWGAEASQVQVSGAAV